MSRKQISSGSKFEAEIGYSRAIVDGDWIWVAGTTGFNYDTMTISALQHVDAFAAAGEVLVDAGDLYECAHVPCYSFTAFVQPGIHQFPSPEPRPT